LGLAAAAAAAPGSHRDPRNPFGPADGITRSAPIPEELQVVAPAGSVFLQDTRCWHSSPLSNRSGADRVAMARLAQDGLTLSADIYLNVLNNSYDRMYI
jgi:hypothetical protein